MDRRKVIEQYVRYSTIGFQIVAFLGVFVWLGYTIDRRLENERLWGTLIFSLLACVMAITYLIYKLGGVDNKSGSARLRQKSKDETAQ